jgi:hypothetical protein
MIPHAKVDVELAVSIFAAASDLSERAADVNEMRFYNFVTEKIRRDRLSF